jgi:molybdopterin-guanine dinucleotide biosynthesis protein B
MKVMGIIGYKNAGKTSLVERLVTEITGRGYSVSTVKHAHHAFDLDQPGKDTFRHRAAGARQVMLATGARWVLMSELRDTAEPPLADLLARLDPVDLVLVEGYKRDSHRKIEVHRPATGHPLIAPGDPTVIAVATDGAPDVSVPVLDLNDLSAIADAILRDTGLADRAKPFDSFLMVDWSGGNDTGSTPRKDAIWACLAHDGGTETPVYLRNRQIAEDWIIDRITRERAAGRRVCVGFDFPFATPAGFAQALTGRDDPLALLDWFAAQVQDGSQWNNRFDLAGEINGMFPGIGPFWGNGLAREIADLPRKGNARTFRWPNPKREVEARATGAFECWQLSGAGAVGSQMIMGMPVLSRLRHHFAGQIAVWPFDTAPAPITLMEIWPSLLRRAVQTATRPGDIKDAVQVQLLAATMARLTPDALARMMNVPQDAEGWIFGVDHAAELSEVAIALIATSELRR